MEEVMKDHRLIAIGAFLGFAVLAAIGAATVHAQQQTDRLLEVMMSEIGLPGYVNAVRTTIEPGKKSTPHSHAGRIAIQVVLQGTALEHRGDQLLAHNAGDVYSVPEGAEHWFENKGTVPMIYVEMNIRPKAPEPAAPAARPNTP
jgi:quercetin dioxygenase-like cupin family protein